MNMKKKIFSLLVLLMTAVTGAWATDYYVVGTMTKWQKNDQYKMTLNASAATTEYQLGIALAATDQFKVIGEDGDNPWVWYPSGDNYGQNGELTADGLYTIYFRPNGDGGSDWFYNYIYVAEDAYLAETSGEWTLTQPAFDVELEVEYFALATLATQPAAAEGVVEGTDAALLTPGTSAEGTLAYAIGTSEAPTGQWSDAIPTAQDLAAGTCYVWYKVVGDAEHSDSQPQSIAVTVAALPAFAVTIDDAGVDASNWQATPTEPKTGQTVTLSYSGKKKIRSITIEAAPVPVTYTELNGGEVLHVGDIINLSEEIYVNDGYYMGSYGSPYTVVRADLTIDKYEEIVVNEKADGNYYVIKANDGYYYHFQRALGVTSTSDGILVTYNGKSGSYKSYTFTVHEP